MWKRLFDKLKGYRRFAWLAIVLQGIQAMARLLWDAADWVGRISDLKLILTALRDYSLSVLSVIFSVPGAVITFIVGFSYLIWDSKASKKEISQENIQGIEKEKFQKELGDAAERSREILVSNQFIKPPQAPPSPSPSGLPPLFLANIQIKPVTVSDPPHLSLLFENTSDKPIEFKILIEKEQHWSEKQKRFISYSYSLDGLPLQSEKILEPDNTRPIPLVTEKQLKGEHLLMVHADLPFEIPIKKPGIHLMSIKVESKAAGNRRDDFFINWIPKQTLEFVEDPRKKL